MRCQTKHPDDRQCWKVSGHEEGCDFMPGGWETGGACIEENEGVMFAVVCTESYEFKPVAMFLDEGDADLYVSDNSGSDYAVVRVYVMMTGHNGFGDLPWLVEDIYDKSEGSIVTVTFKRPGTNTTAFQPYVPATKTFTTPLPWGLDKKKAIELIEAFKKK